jgi:hypothetical protein
MDYKETWVQRNEHRIYARDYPAEVSLLCGSQVAGRGGLVE